MKLPALAASARRHPWWSAALSLLLVPALGALVWLASVHAIDYPAARLSPRAVASLDVVDRNGTPIWRSSSKAGEPRAWVSLQDIEPLLIDATLAAEDHRFHEHGGVDPWAVLRAVWLDLRALKFAYGASTLSMQLVRLLEPELNTHSVFGKVVQALYAARLERALSKRQIIEQYLNRAYYGHGAFGVEAAAERYFASSARAVSPAQAAFLAALPRAPLAYDPFKFKQRAEQRQRHILTRMHALGWLSAQSLELARAEPLTLRSIRSRARAQHFVDHLINTLDFDAVYGGTLDTTLDLDLQQQVEVAIDRHLDAIGSRDVTQAGVIVLDNRTGDILAMVGSGDYGDSARDGAVNVTTLRRRPGSTLKPFVYALALERGESPASLAYDVVLPGEATETYTSDVRQHGFARYREALAGSYNLAAVHTLQHVGVENLVSRLRRAGLSTLDEPATSYGPDLAIGNAEVLLSEYAGAFAAFGNGGRAVTPRAVRGYRSALGADALLTGSLTTHGTTSSQRPLGERGPQPQLFSAAISYQIFDILSDPDARRPMFGLSAPMDLPFPVALKTGTTRGYTDNLAFGTTRQYTVGAWAGNFDGKPMQGVMAMQGAAPLVRAAFVALAARFGDPTAPERPSTLVTRDVCSMSGQRPGPYCPGRKQEWVDASQLAHFEQAPTCQFHSASDPNNRVAFPPELAHWARARHLPDRGPAALAGAALQIAYPPSGTRFVLDPHRPAHLQRPPLQALPLDPRVAFTIDGVPADQFEPTPGRHLVRAELDAQHAESEIFYE